jgi:hypothetical protein
MLQAFKLIEGYHEHSCLLCLEPIGVYSKTGPANNSLFMTPQTGDVVGRRTPANVSGCAVIGFATGVVVEHQTTPYGGAAY